MRLTVAAHAVFQARRPDRCLPGRPLEVESDGAAPATTLGQLRRPIYPPTTEGRRVNAKAAPAARTPHTTHKTTKPVSGLEKAATVRVPNKGAMMWAAE